MCSKNDQKLREALKKSKFVIKDEEVPITEFLNAKIEEIDIKLEESNPNNSDEELSGNENTNDFQEDFQSSSSDEEILSKIKDRLQKPPEESDLEEDSNDELSETLKCEKCDSEFKSNSRFKKHQVAKHGELYNCSKCDEKFKMRNDLLRHQSVVHNMEKYKCKICSRRYCYRVSLNRHIKKYHKELCSSNETDDELTENQKNTFKCEKCDSLFSSEIFLQSHDVSEHNGSFECKLCDKRFTGRQYIVRHNKIVHGEEMHPCTVCNKKYKYKKFLKRHMDKNHGTNPENQFQCTVCPKKFSTLARFNFHTKNHFLPKIHQCDICSKMFKTETSLRTHKTTHLTFEERSTTKSVFLCPICGKILFSQSGRDVHIRTHTEDKQFKCTICSWAFKEKSQLEVHMTKHSDDRPFKCEICGFCVKNAQQFNSHKMTHKLKTMEKQFECKICGVKMRYKISLSHHMRNVHLGIRNHKCDECDSAFYTSNLLKQHKAKKHQSDF